MDRIYISKAHIIHTGLKESDLKNLYLHMCKIGQAVTFFERLMKQYGPMDNRGKLLDALAHLEIVDDKIHSYLSDVEDACGPLTSAGD